MYISCNKKEQTCPIECKNLTDNHFISERRNGKTTDNLAQEAG